MGHANQPLWDRIKNRVQQGSKGGLPGQWSARKAQILVKEYKDSGGKFTGSKDPQNSLTKWTKQNWRTRSGKPSLKTGERYLPAKAIKSLTSSEYARTTRKKREGMRQGKQFVRQPKSIRNKTRKFRLF
jgi:hypothetical protein